jgi:amino acid transporter
VAYSFQGVEVIAVTAFEARDASALRWPSKWIAYVVFLLYLFCTIGETINIPWSDPNLPLIPGGNTTAHNSTTNVIVSMTFNAGYQNLAGFINF